MHVEIAKKIIDQQHKERIEEAVQARRALELPSRSHSLRLGSYQLTWTREPRPATLVR